MHARVIALATVLFVIVSAIAALGIGTLVRSCTYDLSQSPSAVCGMGVCSGAPDGLHRVDRRSVARAIHGCYRVRRGDAHRPAHLAAEHLHVARACFRLRSVAGSTALLAAARLLSALDQRPNEGEGATFHLDELLFLLAHLHSDQSRSTRRCRVSFEDAGHGRKLRIPDGVVALGHVQQAQAHVELEVVDLSWMEGRHLVVDEVEPRKFLDELKERVRA